MWPHVDHVLKGHIMLSVGASKIKHLVLFGDKESSASAFNLSHDLKRSCD